MPCPGPGGALLWVALCKAQLFPLRQGPRGRSSWWLCISYTPRRLKRLGFCFLFSCKHILFTPQQSFLPSHEGATGRRRGASLGAGRERRGRSPAEGHLVPSLVSEPKRRAFQRCCFQMWKLRPQQLRRRAQGFCSLRGKRSATGRCAGRSHRGWGRGGPGGRVPAVQTVWGRGLGAPSWPGGPPVTACSGCEGFSRGDTAAWGWTHGVPG